VAAGTSPVPGKPLSQVEGESLPAAEPTTSNVPLGEDRPPGKPLSQVEAETPPAEAAAPAEEDAKAGPRDWSPSELYRPVHESLTTYRCAAGA
jgi:hypothetical protein